MPSVSVERTVDFAPGHVWAVLADFGAFRDWALGGEGSIKVEGDGPGMVRLLDVPGMGEIAERLEKADDENHHLVYSLFHGNPLGMMRYTANVHLSPEPGGKCKVSWHGEFDPMPEANASTVAQHLRGSYNSMTDALEAFLAK